MNQDGTFTGRETYTGDDILTHARAWTGYDLADQRSNIELLRRTASVHKSNCTAALSRRRT